MQLALYQPDIPQNTGSLIRLCACLGMQLHIIEPCGFLLDDKRLKRVAMDYSEAISPVRHASWEQFLTFRQVHGFRLILLTTKASQSYIHHAFQHNDMLVLGRESSGVPDEVRQAADAQLRIPLHPRARSLNVALAAAMVAGEALRQTNGFLEAPCP